jgi:rubrerythrin
MTIQMTGADIVDLAVQTETRGEAFYLQAAQRASSPEGKDLFRYLAGEERKHKAIFERLADTIVTTEIDVTTWDEALAYIEATVDQAFFARGDAPMNQIEAQGSEADMVAQALAFERQTLLFFGTMRELVSPSNRTIVDEVTREERRHVVRLSAMLADALAREGSTPEVGG